ncbi:hypothetical protein LPJ78_004911 [Coemansia sp. RSA 989]|nr:hypothetical protein BX667DRAFT_525285 [Coemansia mojavensis]KAJ1749241.1 hypothetical protein LPJ79_003895 [Coemansia sp. RSA 1821]KAJ1862146.1 hypothetical protein LPJ78_004911 [Coemansia sp. RSA 989]KAJ1871175.1 hypothetical protein LPJ55_004108 [Coemansia sp. RSA 990]
MAVIRKQKTSFWDAIRDWILHIVEDYELIDWNRVSEATSWPCALAFNVLFVMVSMARQISSRQPDFDAIIDPDTRHRLARASSSSRWNSAYRDHVSYAEQKHSRWSGILLLFQVSLYLISLINAWWLFSTRRTYQMRMMDAAKASSNCRRVPLGTRRPSWARSFAGKVVWAIWKRIARIDDQIQGEIWELSLWTPTTFSRNLFCWYSPVQLLIMSFMNGSNWYYILPLAAAVAVQCTFVVFTYSRLVKDKQVLFGEMYNEYNENFVNPRVFAPKTEAATSTMEDWALARSNNRMPSNFASARANLERIRKSDGMRRRTTALPASEAEPRETMRRGGYRKTMDHASLSRPAEPAPAPYVVSHHQVHRNSRIDGLQPAGARRSLAYEDQNMHLQREPHRTYIEPSGSHRIRDRSTSRRRYTESLESARYGR